MNYDSLEEFGAIVLHEENHFNKIRVGACELLSLLKFLKNAPEYDFHSLNTIIAVDLGVENSQFELIYDLSSFSTGKSARISLLVDRSLPHAPSVVSLFKSAHFDECEIFDLFGINFDGNKNLKRLLMPKGWIGHQLRKDYKQNDERLSWNENNKVKG